jgi:ERCC4-type nuclease
MAKMPYFVGSLNIGDYIFCSGNRLCPILVERKSIQDIALSIHDGRWTKQKQRMYHGQFVFGYENCRVAYIVEGKEETQQVTGGYIGHRQYNVSRERLDQEIENLKKEGFDVLRTT